MQSSSFLFDEHIPRAVARGLKQREPSISIFRVGRPDAPPKQTSDVDLLYWIEEHDCLLVTNNRATMPGHLQEHLKAENHIPGILTVSHRLSLGDLINELYLIWEASLPGEFRDQIIYLPLTI